MSTAIQLFEKKKLGQIRAYIDREGTAWLNATDVASGLGFAVKDKYGNTIISWEIINRYLLKFGYKFFVEDGDFIPEHMFYRLAMKADNPFAEKFQSWIAEKVIPALRKTGTYSAVDSHWIATRESGKFQRKQETNVIKLYINYARAQGDYRPEGQIYAKFSNIANRAAGIAKGKRGDSAETSASQLNICELVEKIIKNVLIQGMARGKHFAQIESQIIVHVDDFLKITFSGTLPLLDS